MTNILTLVFEIYGIAFIGFIVVKLRWFSLAATDGLIKFVFNISIPALMFRSLSQMELPEVLPVKLIASYYIAVLGVLFTGMVVSRFLFKYPNGKQVIFTYGGSFSNTVLLGVPIIISSLGDESAFPLFLLISFHGVSLLSTMTIFLEMSSAGGGTFWGYVKTAFAGVLKNPIIWGIVLGVLFNLTGTGYPVAVDEMLKMIAQTAIPCSLFSFGAMLSGYKIAGEVGASLAISAIKNLLHPALVWLLATRVFGIPLLWAQTATLLAAMPTGFNIFLFAHRYQQAIEMSTTAISISTIISIFTVSLLIFWFGI
ncbi:MAG: AEC family transporter [Calditrichia bacterium]